MGENLQDHLEFYFQFKCKKPISLNGKLDLWNKFLIGARWIFNKDPVWVLPIISNHVVLYVQRPMWNGPIFSIIFCLRQSDMMVKVHFDGHGFQVHVGHNKPKSRGSIKAMCPLTLKIIQRYSSIILNIKDDIEGFRACVRLTREIINQAALLMNIVVQKFNPVNKSKSDEQIDTFVREAVESAYHPSCSCKMGEDELAVVDSEMRVSME